MHCQRIGQWYRGLLYRTEEIQHRIALFGLVMMVNFPLFGIIWKLDRFQPSEEFSVRVIATVLSALLCGNHFWPKKLRTLLPIVWYAGLMFCLPFFFTYMTLLHHAATIWLMNCVTAIFFLFILTGALEAFFLALIGTAFGFLFFFLDPEHMVMHDPGQISFLGLLMTFVAIVVLGTFFAHNREQYYAKKWMGMHAMAESLVKNLQRPLDAIEAHTKLQNQALSHLQDPGLQENLRASLHKIQEQVHTGNLLISNQLNRMRDRALPYCKLMYVSVLLDEVMIALADNASHIIFSKIEDFLTWLDPEKCRSLFYTVVHDILLERTADEMLSIVLKPAEPGAAYNTISIRYPLMSQQSGRQSFYPVQRNAASVMQNIPAYQATLHHFGGLMSMHEAVDGWGFVEINLPVVD